MLIGLLLAAQVSWSANMERGPVRETRGALDIANPQDEIYVLRNGALAFNFTNFGWWGNDGRNQSSAFDDPCTGDWAPQFEYPEGSGIQYGFQGALWIGALIVNGGTPIPRVSLGTDGWQNPSINEFHAGEAPDNGILLRSNIPDATDCFGNSIYNPSALANIEAVAVYTDTLTDQIYVRNDPTDGPHRPLGLEITQTARLWSSPDFARFVIWDFKVRNIGPNFLKQVALGLYLDSDVGSVNENNHHVDDLSGSIVLDPLLHNYLAWSADDDGREHDFPFGPIIYPAAIGAAALTTETQEGDLVHSFNWWSPNSNPSLDYGPAWLENPEWDCDNGSSLGDENKLHVLSNRERDYDQTDFQNPQPHTDTLFACASDLLTHEWCPVDVSFEQTDTRFMLSWNNIGQYDYTDGAGYCVYRLNPGEEFDFTVAIVIGDEFHEEGNPDFNFEGLLESYARARTLFDQDYTYQPPTPALNLQDTHAASGAVPLAWQAPQVGGVTGYRVFGRPDSGNGDRVEFTTNLITEEQYTITGLTNGDYWAIEIETYDSDGYRSYPAKIMARVGAIPNRSELRGYAVNGVDSLSWDATNDPTFSHYELVRVSNVDTVVFDNISGTSFVDNTVLSGRVYIYTLYIENSLSIESLPGNDVTLTPFAPTSPILVYDETKTPTPVDMQRGAVPDSLVRQYYQSLLGAMNEPHDYMEVAYNAPPLPLETLAQYGLVFWHSENPTLLNNQYNVQQREAVFRDYIGIGGKLIRFGRNALVASDFRVGPSYSPSALAPLTFDSVWAAPLYSPPNPASDVRTIGADAQSVAFPSLIWDQDKMAALTFFGQTGYEFLPGIDFFWRRGNTWSLYNVALHESDTSAFDNSPCAVIGPGVIFFGFPLYFIPEQEAEELLAASLHALRTQVLDTPDLPIEPLPTAIDLPQNYPNPFNPSTTIEFDLPMTLNGSLKIYNIRGQLVETLMSGTMSAGFHSIQYDATGLASGLYFYRLEVGSFTSTKKMLLIR